MKHTRNIQQPVLFYVDDLKVGKYVVIENIIFGSMTKICNKYYERARNIAGHYNRYTWTLL